MQENVQIPVHQENETVVLYEKKSSMYIHGTELPIVSRASMLFYIPTVCIIFKLRT